MKPVTLDTLVLATDGSADAVLARRAVIDLAQTTDTTVHLVSAWNLATATYGYPSRVIPYDVTTPYEEQTKAIVEREYEALEGAGVRVVATHMVTGRAADAILNVADNVTADLVVVGSRGRGTLSRLVLGSVSDAVVRQSTHPVLVVRGGAESWPPEDVIVGHDGSDEAIATLHLAALVAGRIKARLSVVEVMPPLDEGAVRDGALNLAALLDERRSQLNSDVSDLIGPPPPEIDVRVEIGDPATTLLAAAQPSTMVAVGRRGIGRVREMFLGSVSTKLLHGASGALLVVPLG